MSRIKKPQIETKDETKEATNQTNGMAISANPGIITPEINKDVVEETPIEELPNIVTTESVYGSSESENGQESVTASPQIETTVEDCEVLYGVVMETAHGMIGTKNGKGHRGLPEERRKSQGRLLHSICKEYGITIPTEFELVIFGGALIADWRYMTVEGGESIEQTNDNSDEE